MQLPSYEVYLIRGLNYNKVLQQEQPIACTELVMEFIPPARWRRGIEDEAYAGAERPR
jgi:hypothetical protein